MNAFRELQFQEDARNAFIASEQDWSENCEKIMAVFAWASIVQKVSGVTSVTRGRHCSFSILRALADKYGLWNAATLIHEDGCYSDGFEDFRAWLIFQGKETSFSFWASPPLTFESPDYYDPRGVPGERKPAVPPGLGDLPGQGDLSGSLKGPGLSGGCT